MLPGPIWLGRLKSGTLTPMEGTDELRNSPKLIRRWTRRWGVPALAGEITCQWSPRLRRSLGRAYPQRKLIRLSRLLQEPQYASLFEEVLCHEACAHCGIPSSWLPRGRPRPRLGRTGASCGPRTAAVLRDRLAASAAGAGFGARMSISARSATLLALAKRPQPRWCCVACQIAGLEGKLIIQSRPMRREAVDV